MSTLASLLPQLREVALDATGAPMAGALLYSYAAGTTTPLATYSDSGLTTPNTNPVVANAGGLFGPIYLSNAGYKFDLQSSAAVSLYTQDNVYPAAYLASNAVQGTIAATCQGRLTLTTGVPVTTSDVTAATTLRYALYKGNSIGLYDGTQWNLRTFTELSIAVPATTSQVYDVWVFDNSGTPALELLAWTNDTTRATALTTQDGVYVKTGALTRRYVGSFRTTTVSGQTEDSLAKRYVWNYYHRDRRPMQVTDATASWAYTTATFRQARATATNQLALVIGVSEDAVQADVYSLVANTNTSVLVQVAVGLDSTTTVATNSIGGMSQSAVANVNTPVRASFSGFVGVGFHTLVWLEISAATGTTTWSTGGFSGFVAGITGAVLG